MLQPAPLKKKQKTTSRTINVFLHTTNSKLLLKHVWQSLFCFHTGSFKEPISACKHVSHFFIVFLARLTLSPDLNL